MRAPVVQRDATGCGIACVATIVGVTYAQARAVAERLGISPSDPRLWSETAYVRRLLRHWEVPVGRSIRPFRSWEEVPDLALLAVRWHLERGRPCWHWVVFVRDEDGARVLDSKRGLRRPVRRDFGRMSPAWFMPVGRVREQA